MTGFFRSALFLAAGAMLSFTTSAAHAVVETIDLGNGISITEDLEDFGGEGLELSYDVTNGSGDNIFGFAVTTDQFDFFEGGQDEDFFFGPFINVRQGWAGALLGSGDWDDGFPVTLREVPDFFTDDLGSFNALFGGDGNGAFLFWNVDGQDILAGTSSVDEFFISDFAPFSEAIAFTSNGTIIGQSAVPEPEAIALLGLGLVGLYGLRKRRKSA